MSATNFHTHTEQRAKLYLIYIKYKLIASVKLVALTFELHSFAHCTIEDKGDKMMAIYWKLGFSGIIL
jgi:hypothetical protein